MNLGRLHAAYGAYTVCFVVFVLLLAWGEQHGLPAAVMGGLFFAGPLVVYAVIGVLSRTSAADEYYVAGRRVPAFYNGMATAADWLSAASFIGMVGTLYVSGYGGLAYVLGWTGGFCLVALLLAPYLRSLGHYTVPDFLGQRYGGAGARLVGLGAAVLCSFVYLVAQIYGVGLVITRLTQIASFEVGVFLGLGGMLVCSFLGGMRAITWTQVAQYIVLIIAFLTPAVWMGWQQTGQPLVPASVVSTAERVSAAEARLMADPREQEVLQLLRARAAVLRSKLADVPTALQGDRDAAAHAVRVLIASDAPQRTIQAAERAQVALPRDEAAAIQLWRSQLRALEARALPLGGLEPHAAAPEGPARTHFLALVFCLALGTAGLPHLLTRYYTTASVVETRRSVVWTLVFVMLLYLTAPALALLVKAHVLEHLVGTPMDALPAWISHWQQVAPDLLDIEDINRDGVLQLAELQLDGDLLMLATPELAGLPLFVTGLVAAGGLAAALSTADGLLLTIANALSHDLYVQHRRPGLSATQRVVLSKLLLLAVAGAAAAVAAQRPANILFMVAASFSLAAATFVPALVLGIFWRRTNGYGAVAGMLTGLGACLAYMTWTHPWLASLLGRTPAAGVPGIGPDTAAVLAVPMGAAVTVLVSLLTPKPGRREQAVMVRMHREQ